MIEKNDRKKTKLTVVLLFIIITIIIIVGIVFALLIIKKEDEKPELPEFSEEEYQKILKNIKSKENYNSNEIYTDFNYYYLTIMDSSYSGWHSSLSDYNYNNILKEVTFVRYVYQNNNWVLAENKNNSPFFNQTGNGIIVNSERYYIPVYELEEGKNKVIVTEITNGGTKKEKEFIINRTSSEYDNMYQIKVVNKSDTLRLDTYQDVINVNMNDYNNILLTGSFFSNYALKDITWTRYEHENNSEEWKVIPKSQTNRVFYQSEGKAKITGNYWAIDILNTDSKGTKIEITATDLAGSKITKTVLINSTSQTVDEKFGENTDISGKIVDDNGRRFINNEVIIFFNENVDESRCKEIIKEINGKIKNSLGFIKNYEVQLNYKFSTYESIKKYCKTLEELYDEILSVNANLIYEIIPN